MKNCFCTSDFLLNLTIILVKVLIASCFQAVGYIVGIHYGSQHRGRLSTWRIIIRRGWGGCDLLHEGFSPSSCQQLQQKDENKARASSIFYFKLVWKQHL